MVKYGIIVLDLDETLFHTKQDKIHHRPYLVKFLTYISKYFYLVVFTAAVKQYADSILSKIKVSKTGMTAGDLFVLKLYRSSCSNGKDLSKVLKRLLEDKLKQSSRRKYNVPKNMLFKTKNGRSVLNFDHIVLVDNLSENFVGDQIFNGIPIIDYTTNKNDTALQKMTKFFKTYVNKSKSSPKKKMSLRTFLYRNLHTINDVLKIKYEKC